LKSTEEKYVFVHFLFENFPSMLQKQQATGQSMLLQCKLFLLRALNLQMPPFQRRVILTNRFSANFCCEKN